MKKFVKTLAFTLAMVMLLSISAMAAAPVVTPAEGKDVEFTVAENKVDTLTYRNSNIVKGGQYMIFVVDGDVPTASTILYVNQTAAVVDGAVTFENVFPTELKNSNIMISGTNLDGLRTVAMITVKEDHIMGDVTKDKQVNTADAMLLLQYVAGLVTFDSAQIKVGNVTGGDLNSADAMLLLQVAAGLATLN